MFHDPFSGGISFNSLPDELLREVLRHILDGDLPHARFVSSAARFTSTDASRVVVVASAHYLTVSRRWLRAGQPLLYGTVILRSPAQVAALARTLAAYPERGLYVRRLRIEEGAYCARLKDVLACTPCVGVLVLGLEVYKAAHVDGLCAGLERLAPQAIVLHDPMSTVVDNGAVTKLTEAIARMVAGSGYLRTFEWRGPRRSKPYVLDRTAVFASALAQAPSLNTVAIPGHGNTELPLFVDAVLRNGTLRKVQIVSSARRMRKKLEKAVLSKEGIRERMIFMNSFSSQSVAQRTVLKVIKLKKPLKNLNLPTLPENVLKRIIVLALQSFKMVDLTRFSDGLNETEFPAFDSLCKTFIRVSKLFSHVTRPYLPLNVGLDDEPKSKTQEKLRIFRSIASTPNLASAVRSLHIDVPRVKLGADIVVDVVCQLGELDTLVMPVYPKDVRPLAARLGATLRRVDLYLEGGGVGDDAGGTFCAYDWAGFTSVEALWIRLGNGVTVKRHEMDGLEPVRFDKLRFLTIQDYVDIRAYELMSHWDVRSVQCLKIAGFIHTSGRPWETQVVQRFFASLLPAGNLKILSLGCCVDGPDPELVACIPVNDTVERIVLCFPQHERRAYLNTLVRTFFHSAALGERFRALEAVQVRSLPAWPSSEAEIRRSPWPACVDGLVETFAMTVTDGDGRVWKPRLRV